MTGTNATVRGGRPPRGRSRWSGVLVGGLTAALAIAAALAGDTGTVRRVRSDPEAVRLLRAATGAAQRVPYEGRRFLTTWSSRRTSTSTVRVTHTPGDGTYYQSDSDGRAYQPDAAAFWGGSYGFTSETLTLLTRNYTVVRAPDAAVCGRPAQVVEARRPDGSPAGRFWLDTETGLMLHRELIDAAGHRVAATGFTEVNLAAERGGRGTLRAGRSPTKAPARTPVDAPAKGIADGAVPATLWADRLDGAELAELRDNGWPVPRSLPGRLKLYDARRPQSGGDVVHLSYSDGLAAVSVFVQHGNLDDRRFGDWQKTGKRDRTVFRREALQRWAVSAGNGYVYTVLTDAPQSTADAVARTLPRDGTPFWRRLGRGFRRVGSWINPFG
ncbi:MULTISPECIES: MucB/RseB C-terminal domain-containing protein [Thermomonosporaceae]|uniref:MucB/RseB C-terminal domain-containing protein n=1 Tax=Thermomonosporaceae TaxID=2012 RepID=UPI00255A9FF2|nr:MULTISPECIES: MucB/RseB C-terminal domain-containing protein [Thermomonosporaceae]MDL4772102.1 MucB/RseB C-terminal domain-containing protein [Actinomadura xylanilytica]